MKTLKRLLAAAAIVVLLGLPQLAFSQTWTVCRKYDANHNCNKCIGNYITGASQSETEAKCAQLGYDEAYHFPGPAAVAAWKLSQCTCR